MSYVFKKIKSPVGELKLIASEKGLAAVLWPSDKATRVKVSANQEKIDHPILIEAERQLREYFDRKRESFSLYFDLHGTHFQKTVWQELAKIPFGETRTYGEIAKKIGRPKAVRAVGAANGKNPIAIFLPCHRVIGANRKLTGFAGGLIIKEQLLKLEGF